MMTERQFTSIESLGLVSEFAFDVWQFCKERFSEEELDNLQFFSGILHGDPGTPSTWESVYVSTFGKDYPIDSRPLNEHEIFTLLIEMSALYIHKYGFRLEGFLNLLFQMRYKPESCERECKLWRDGIQFFLDLDKRG